VPDTTAAASAFRGSPAGPGCGHRGQHL